MLVQLAGRAASESKCPQPALGTDVPRGLSRFEQGRRIAEHDHRELQALRSVYRQQSHAISALLHHGRFLALAALCLLIDELDERAERGRAARLEASGGIREP